MSVDRLIAFLNTQSEFYIEVEGTLDRIQNKFGSYLTADDPGVCALDPNSNKWGLEYRLYTHDRPDPPLGNEFHSNTAFRHPEYEYRLSKKELISELLLKGYSLGDN